MDELAFAMGVAIVGSVMVFMTILTLFYFLAWLSIKAIIRLQKEWNKKEEK
jgi:hypothetical protein